MILKLFKMANKEKCVKWYIFFLISLCTPRGCLGRDCII